MSRVKSKEYKVFFIFIKIKEVLTNKVIQIYKKTKLCIRKTYFFLEKINILIKNRIVKLIKLFIAFIKILDNLLQTLLGFFYFQYKQKSEINRINRYRLEKETNNNKIIIEILKYSKKILIYLLIFGVLSFVLDFYFWKLYPTISSIKYVSDNFKLPDEEFLRVGLEVFVGAISGILGLIFAMFTVGIQLTNDKYSEKVSDFINQENVSDYFFSFLIFTDLFSLLILFKLSLVPQLPIFSFIFASIFVALSLLGIIIFKKHYINSLKPLNLFSSIWRLFLEQIPLVTDSNSYKYKSWSLVTHARDNINRYINVLGDLFQDLIKNNNWSDASYAPIFLGEIFRDYICVKNNIDKERGRWFYEKYEQVSANDLNLFPIKMNYELKGQGSLYLPKFAENWFEDKVINLFKDFSKNISSDKSNKLLKRISQGYKTFLVGDYKEQKGRQPELKPGAMAKQEFEIVEKGLDAFFLFSEQVNFDNSTNAMDFLNDYFAISEGLIEEWDIESALEIASSFYIDDQLCSIKIIKKEKKLPTYTKEVLTNHWRKLEVEQTLEGKIITPKNKLLDEIKKELNKKREEVINHFLEKLFANSDKIITNLYRQKNYDYLGNFIKMQFEWINRLLYIGDYEIANNLSKNIGKNLFFINHLEVKKILELEYLELAERGFFMSVFAKTKQLYGVYSLLVVTMFIKSRNQETDVNKIVRLMKIPLILGGFTFLVSEYEQDYFYVNNFSKILEDIEVMFNKPLIDVFEQISELNIPQNIYWETTRYSDWFQKEQGIIRKKLSTVPSQNIGEIGYSLEFDHPSQFIKTLAQWDVLIEENCMGGFIEWLKKRSELKKLLTILSVINKNESR